MNLIRRATKLALVLSPVIAAPAFSQGPQKIGYVDSKVILSRAPGRQAAEDQFNKEMETSRSQVQKMGDSLQTMIADYQKAQATLAANVREQRESAIRKKQEDYQARAGALDQQMQQRQVELRPYIVILLLLGVVADALWTRLGRMSDWAGRRKVAEWLKYLENQTAHHAGAAGMPAYDFGWMWEELKVADLRR